MVACRPTFNKLLSLRPTYQSSNYIPLEMIKVLDNGDYPYLSIAKLSNANSDAS